MPVFRIENEFNNKIELTHNENKWQLLSVTGLSSPPAAISSSIIPTFDGERFNSSRLEARNIVILLVINGNAEENRMALNKVILPKRFIKFYYENNAHKYYINGVVESFEYDVFENKIKAQISIICMDPYFKDEEETTEILTSIINLFEFPFSIPEEGIALGEITENKNGEITNSGTIPTGCEITIEASGEIINPYIENITTGEKIKINRTIYKNDTIKINTNKGNKSIYLYSGNEIINIINDFSEDSQWLTLTPGANIFIYGSDSGTNNMQAKISYKNLYGGV